MGIGLHRCERHIDVFEDGAWSDAAKPWRRFHQVIARKAGVLTAESVDEEQRFGELTSAHQETRAVDGPRIFKLHTSLPLGGGRRVASREYLVSGFRAAWQHAKFHAADNAAARGWIVARSEATVRACRRWVNYKRIVQRWNSLSKIRREVSRSRPDEGQPQCAHAGLGLGEAWRTAGGRRARQRAEFAQEAHRIGTVARV